MSEHFSEAEFIASNTAKAKNIINEVPVYLKYQMIMTLAGLERIREVLQAPIRITSGYRCLALNKLVGGSENSQHIKAEAVDFVCPDYGTPREICLFLSGKMGWLGIDQLIQEGVWVHASFTLTPRYEILTKTGFGYSKGIV